MEAILIVLGVVSSLALVEEEALMDQKEEVDGSKFGPGADSFLGLRASLR